MSKRIWISSIVSMISLGIASVIMLVYLTETNGLQIIILQPLYSTLDKSGLLLRSLVFLIFSLAGAVILSRNAQNLKTNAALRDFVVIILLGLLTSLAVLYGFSCCDSPVVIFMGFPFSWLRGVTPAQHYLTMPAFQYLIMNFRQINWNIDAFSLITNMLFWYNVS